MKIIYEEDDIQGGMKIGYSHGAFLLAVETDNKGKQHFFRVSLVSGHAVKEKLTKKQVVELMNKADYKVWK